MQYSETQLSSITDAPAGLQALFAEVSSLAGRLRAVTGSNHPGDQLPIGGLSVVRVLIGHGPQTVPQIARLRGTSRQNIQMLVNRLEAEGCVELSHNPAHKRSGLVSLTELGKALFSTAAEQEANFLADIAASFPEAEVLSAASLLRRLREMLAKGGDQAEATADEQVPKQRHGDGLPRKAGRKPSTPVRSNKAPPTAVIPPESEPDEGELPYNLL